MVKPLEEYTLHSRRSKKVAVVVTIIIFLANLKGLSVQ